MFITAPGPNRRPNFSRRRGCPCGCAEDDDFWADDFGGRLDGIFGPISQANFTRMRNTAPCIAYTTVWLHRARARDDEADEAAEGEVINPPGVAAAAPEENIAAPKVATATSAKKENFGGLFDGDTDEDEEEEERVQKPKAKVYSPKRVRYFSPRRYDEDEDNIRYGPPDDDEPTGNCA